MADLVKLSALGLLATPMVAAFAHSQWRAWRLRRTPFAPPTSLRPEEAYPAAPPGETAADDVETGGMLVGPSASQSWWVGLLPTERGLTLIEDVDEVVEETPPTFRVLVPWSHVEVRMVRGAFRDRVRLTFRALPGLNLDLREPEARRLAKAAGDRWPARELALEIEARNEREARGPTRALYFLLYAVVVSLGLALAGAFTDWPRERRLAGRAVETLATVTATSGRGARDPATYVYEVGGRRYERRTCRCCVRGGAEVGDRFSVYVDPLDPARARLKKPDEPLRQGWLAILGALTLGPMLTLPVLAEWGVGFFRRDRRRFR